MRLRIDIVEFSSSSAGHGLPLVKTRLFFFAPGLKRVAAYVHMVNSEHIIY